MQDKYSVAWLNITKMPSNGSYLYRNLQNIASYILRIIFINLKPTGHLNIERTLAKTP
jgi:hypothetical protein